MRLERSITRRMKKSKVLAPLSFNSSRAYLERFAIEASESLDQPGVVLDAGAGDCCYEPTFKGHTYESADFCQVDKAYSEVTYVCDLADIPVEADRYDLVFCSQVLEHLPEPKKVLEEFLRVLKPGGKLWLSAPLFFPEHEQPYDFYRYTQFGFEHLLTTSGFAVEDVGWLEGYFGTLSFQFRSAGVELPLSPKSYGGGVVGVACLPVILALKPLLVLLGAAFSALDIRHRHDKSGMCKNYRVVAVKPESASLAPPAEKQAASS